MSNFVKKIKFSDDQNVLFCTDIHGQYFQFYNLLSKFGVKLDTQIVCTGDIVDRGDNSLPLLTEFLSMNENYHLSLGNHEYALIQANKSINNLSYWVSLGGQPTFNELGKSGVAVMSNLLENIPFVIEIEYKNKTFGIVHSCIPKYQNKAVTNWNYFKELIETDENYRLSAIWGDQYTATAINKEDVNYFHHIDGIDYVLHGHFGVKKPFIAHNSIWFDTWYRDEKQFTFLQYNENSDKNNPWNYLKG